MTEAVRFQTRARTVDHLGREQIADCPTAISELWKNSYDAYARAVSLHIFDGDPVVACICDDGHGMSRDEFVNKWLVIGTESKIGVKLTSFDDRNGLHYRKRQGKKGIGRLSAAYLGNLLLLVTKRKDQDYVSALIDWRIFENPFLILDDIRIPITTFSDKSQLFHQLPDLYETLMCNIWGDENDRSQKQRVTQAWKAYDAVEYETKGNSLEFSTTQSRIEDTLINKQLTERHLSEWEVWTGASENGTAMIMAGVIPELEAQLNPTSKSASEKQSRDNFQDTLWSFIDPFVPLTKEAPSTAVVDFSTRVVGWRGDSRLSIIEDGAGFKAHAAGNLEHIIDGYIDDAGCFKGRVKAFGNWLPEEVVIKPAEALPNRANTRVGGFSFYASAMEFERKNTTHQDEEFMQLQKLLEQFSGLMVFRDGFRVMPYGRPDADYFQIEERRSKQAGREFWNHRRMLGRIAISDFGNPNLKDKAGREGIIDNTASKVFKEIVINILMTSARRFFGLDSDIRKAVKPSLNEAYEKKKSAEDREKLLKRKRRQFRKSLEDNAQKLEDLALTAANLKESILTDNTLIRQDQVFEFKKALSAIKQQRTELRLGSAPDRLAPRLQTAHGVYRETMQSIDADVRETEEQLNTIIRSLIPTDPREITKQQLDLQLRNIRRRVADWGRRVSILLDSEKVRISDHAKTRIASIEEELTPLIEEVGKGKVSFPNALMLIEETAELHDRENAAQFSGIISTLESLSENINLDLLATENSQEMGNLRSELDRLNSLAQLGITVEIIDHELATFSSTIGYGLKNFPPEIANSRPYRQVKEAYEGLESRLRFLSPLKLSGEPQYQKIFGHEIAHYVRDFFKKSLDSKEFTLESSEAFDLFSVYEQPARIFPVFINLVNNSRYWIQQSTAGEREITFGVRQGKVVVSDNGPGIQEEDTNSLFSLFFTKRKGGRGVGLYLCRANLAAGGHRISYAKEEALKIHDGANFVIDFKEAVFPK